MSHRTLADFEPLLAGEETLLAGLSSGEVVTIGGTSVPSADAGEARQLRGEFLRYLLLGGCKELKARDTYVHEKGVQVVGALITGVLDLEGCRIPRNIALFNSQLTAVPVFRSATIDNLVLNGSRLLGLEADRLEVKRHVLLRAVVAQGELRFFAAKLGGDLDCDEAVLTAGRDGRALSADGLEAKGSVFLRNVEAKGELRFLGVRLGRDISCTGARLTELNLSGARVAGAFFMREGARVTGRMNLSGAQFSAINDAVTGWPVEGGLILDQCQYGAFVGAPVTAIERIKWLSLQGNSKFGQGFWPQPWEQCAKVLREMGHREDARAILIEKEKRQRADRRKRLWDSYMREDYYGLRLWDWVLAVTVRYGHRPLLAFVWLFGFWLLGAGMFTTAAQNHAIKPNDVRIIRAAEWVACAPDYERDEALGQPAPRNKTGGSQLACFLDQPEAASYPKFNALIYSADTLLPIVAMEMQSYWIPDDSDRGVGKWARRYLWLQIIAGWALSLLAVAGFSGLIKSD